MRRRDATIWTIKKRGVICDDPSLRDNEVFYLLCSNYYFVNLNYEYFFLVKRFRPSL